MLYNNTLNPSTTILMAVRLFVPVRYPLAWTGKMEVQKFPRVEGITSIARNKDQSALALQMATSTPTAMVSPA